MWLFDKRRLKADISSLRYENSEINGMVQRQHEEIKYLAGENDRLREAVQKKQGEINQHRDTLSDFLYNLAIAGITVHGRKSSGDYRYDVTYRPKVFHPESHFAYESELYDFEYSRKEFNQEHIEELKKLVENIGLDDWKVADCSMGFHIKRSFSFEQMENLYERIKETTASLQRMLNDAIKVRKLQSVFTESEAKK